MKLTGEYVFDAPRETVWKALFDPETLAKIMPGCERLEKVDENSYKGVMVVRVGPVQGRFQGKVALSDVEAPDSYRMRIDGQGPTGFMKGEGRMVLSVGETPEKTDLSYDFDAQVGGRLAGVGQRLVETTAKSITRRSLETLNRILVARREGREEDVPAASAGRMAVGVAKDMVKGLFKPDKPDKPDKKPDEPERPDEADRAD